jgi:hypothetical protein
MRTDDNDGKVEWILRPPVIFTERESFTTVERGSFLKNIRRGLGIYVLV